MTVTFKNDKEKRKDGYYWIQELDAAGGPHLEEQIAQLDQGWWWGVGLDMCLGHEDRGTGEGSSLIVLAGPLDPSDMDSLRDALADVSLLQTQVAKLRVQLESQHTLVNISRPDYTPARKLEDELVGGLLRWVVTRGKWSAHNTELFSDMKNTLLALAPAAGMDVEYLGEVLAKLTVGPR